MFNQRRLGAAFGLAFSMALLVSLHALSIRFSECMVPRSGSNRSSCDATVRSSTHTTFVSEAVTNDDVEELKALFSESGEEEGTDALVELNGPFINLALLRELSERAIVVHRTTVSLYSRRC